MRPIASPTEAMISVPTIAASARSWVVDEVAAQLAPEAAPEGHNGDTEPADGERGVRILRGGLSRDSLRLGVLRLQDSEQRIAWLTEHLGELSGSGPAPGRWSPPVPLVWGSTSLTWGS